MKKFLIFSQKRFLLYLWQRNFPALRKNKNVLIFSQKSCSYISGNRTLLYFQKFQKKLLIFQQGTL